MYDKIKILFLSYPSIVFIINCNFILPSFHLYIICVSDLFSDVFIERVLPLYFSKMKNSRVGRERKELIYDFFLFKQCIIYYVRMLSMLLVNKTSLKARSLYKFISKL